MRRLVFPALLGTFVILAGCSPPKTDLDLQRKLGLPAVPGAAVDRRFDVLNIPEGYLTSLLGMMDLEGREKELEPLIGHIREVNTIRYTLSPERPEDILSLYYDNLTARKWAVLFRNMRGSHQVGIFTHKKEGILLVNADGGSLEVYRVKGKIDLGKAALLFKDIAQTQKK